MTNVWWIPKHSTAIVSNVLLGKMLAAWTLKWDIAVQLHVLVSKHMKTRFVLMQTRAPTTKPRARTPRARTPRARPPRARPPRASPPRAILKMTTNASKRKARSYSVRKNHANIGQTSAVHKTNLPTTWENVVPKLAKDIPVFSKLHL